MKLNKWIYTINELFEFCNINFNTYTIFLKGRLGVRDDGEYVCGTCVMSNAKYDDERRKRLIDIYKNNKFLITDIDIKKQHITFNEVGE